VFLHKLESLDQPEGLINTPTNGEIIDGHLPQNTIRIHDEETTESDTSLFNKNSVVPGDCLVKVRDQRVLQSAQTSLLARLLDPGQVGEMRVGGDSDHLAVDAFELFDPFGESDDFSGADEGEIQRIEIDDNIFTLVILEGNFFELTVNHSLSLESRSRLLNLSSQERGGAGEVARFYLRSDS